MYQAVRFASSLQGKGSRREHIPASRHSSLLVTTPWKDEKTAIKERSKSVHQQNFTVVSSLSRASRLGIKTRSSFSNPNESNPACSTSQSKPGGPDVPAASQSAIDDSFNRNAVDHPSSTSDVTYLTMLADQNLIAHLKNTLNSIIKEMDLIDQKKLSILRLGTELRGLLGKAQDEFLAYESSFVTIINELSTNSGLIIALQNFASSLSQLPPLIARIQQHRTLFLNKVFKREIMFAFQEINSYYTSAFIELSMAIGTGQLSVLEAPANKEKDGNSQSEHEVNYSERIAALEKQRICIEAHQYYFGTSLKPLNYKKAIELYRDAAQKGIVDAQISLGRIYLYGIPNVLASDFYQAEKYLKQASMSEWNPHTSYLLGTLYLRQVHLTDRMQKMYLLAESFFLQAAERGHADAQFELGCLYLTEQFAHTEEDLSVDSRRPMAMKWLHSAAEQEHGNAEYKYGELLIEIDKAQGVHYLRRAVEKSIPEAMFALGRYYESVDSIEQDLDRAIGYYRQAVARGHSLAKYHLACSLLLRMNTEGNGRSTNFWDVMSMEISNTIQKQQEILYLFMQADSEGVVEASHQIGRLWESFPSNYNKMVGLWHYKSASMGKVPYPIAALRAASMLYDGIGCKADKRKAHYFYTIAANAGNANALNALGLMYEDGEGCEFDFAKAAELFHQAALSNHPHAHFNLGCLLEKGKGVEQNHSAARSHLQKAMELGYQNAENSIRQRMTYSRLHEQARR